MKYRVLVTLLFILIACESTKTNEVIKNVYHTDTLFVFDTIISPPDTFIVIDTVIVTDTVNTGGGSEQETVADVVASIDSTFTLNLLQKLSSFDRLALNNGTAASRVYITAWLEALGYTVEIQSFPFSYASQNYTGHNIVFEKSGTTNADPIVFGAHYDARSTPMSVTSAPGSSDNGSGTTIVMNTARLLAEREIETTIRFVLFDAEEQGLYGSRHYSDSLKNAGQNLSFMFNIDMVGGFPSMSHTTIVCEEDRNNTNADDNLSKALNNELVSAINQFSTLTPVKGGAYGTDYIDFERNGYTIVGLFEHRADVDNPHYHKSSDTFANTKPSYFFEVLKGATGFILTQAKLANE